MFDNDRKVFRKTTMQLRGFSLGELLIVVLIVTLLAIAIIMAYQNQVSKARDTQRKEHLNKFRIAFEDYYNDIGCYPSLTLWNSCTCDGNCLSPHMEKFLCDPTTRTRYYYTSVVEGGDQEDCPTLGYRLFAKLENKGDPDIVAVGCSPVIGCGAGYLANYNWGINMGGALTAADFDPNATPPPTAWQAPPNCTINDTGPWACQYLGRCHSTPLQYFTNGLCSVGFTTADCCEKTYVNGECPTEIRCKPF